MSEKRKSNDWICKESQKRPNMFYYFNTKTGESSWEKPTELLSVAASLGETAKNLPGKSNQFQEQIVKMINSSAEQNVSNSKEKKISSKSREVKKSKTPAQDRLKNLISKNRNVAAALKEAATSCNETKSHHFKPQKVKTIATKSVQSRLEDTPKRLNSVKSSNNNNLTDSNRHYNANINKHKQSKIIKTKHSTHKAPAQQRLNDLQKTLIKEQLLNASESEKSSEHNKRTHIASAVSSVSVAKATDSDVGLIDLDVDLNPAQDEISVAVDAAMMVDIEEMDWQPASLSESLIASKNECPSANIAGNDDRAVIVPDTNIFLSSLICIKDIIAKEPNRTIKIPYMVLQELDKLKNKMNDTVSQMATRAIHYIFTNMKEDNQGRITGQSAIEDCRHLIEIHCPDDKILNCCMQLKELGCNVVLLSNDKNLIIKAKVNQVKTLTSRLCNEKYDNENR